MNAVPGPPPVYRLVYDLGLIAGEQVAVFTGLFALLGSLLAVIWHVQDRYFTPRNHRPGDKIKTKMMLSDSELERSSAQTACELKRVPSDLHKYRKRIESGVEDQRKHREILQGLQDKVMRYRQRSAAAEATAASSARSGYPGHVQSFPSLWQADDDAPAYGYQSGPAVNIEASLPSFNHPNPGFLHGRSASQTLARRSIRFNDGYGLPDTGLDDSAIAIYRNRLKEEQYRVSVLEDMLDSMKRQSETTAKANETLAADVVKMHENILRLEQSRRQSADYANHREHKLRLEKQALESHLMELGSEITALKRRLTSFKTDMKTDLDMYKSDLERSSKSMQDRLQYTEITKSATYQKITKDHEAAMEEIVKRYDDAVVSGLKSEQERNEIARKLIRLENSLKKTQEEKERVEEYLTKIHVLPELSEALGRRTRSVSPVRIGTLGHETIRNIRLALQARTAETDQARRETDVARDKIAELEARLEKSETEKKAVERSLKAEKAEKLDCEQEKLILEQQAARQREKLEKAEAEATNQAAALLKANEQLVDLKVAHQTELDELRVKLELEWDEKWKLFIASQDGIEQNFNARLQRAKQEAETLRSDATKQRTAYNELQSELVAERRRVTEKEREVEEANHRIGKAESELAVLTSTVQEKEVQILHLEKENSEVHHREKVAAERIEELLSEKTTLTTENISLNSTITDLKAEIEDWKTKLENQESQSQNLQTELETYQQQVDSLEKVNSQTRNALADVEHKLELAADRLAAMEQELVEEKREAAQSMTLIGDLNHERADLIKRNESLASDVQSAKHATALEAEKRAAVEKLNADLEAMVERSNDKIERLNETKHKLTAKIKDLSGQLAQLQESLVKAEEDAAQQNQAQKAEIARIRSRADETTKRLQEELTVQAENFEDERTRLKNDTSTVQLKLEQANAAIEKASEEYRLLQEEYELHTTDHVEERDYLRAELAQVTENARQDLVASEHAHRKQQADFEAQLQVLQKQLTDLDTVARESAVRENENRLKADMLEARLGQGAEMVLKLKRQLEELGDRSDEISAQAESEKEILRTQLTQLNDKLRVSKDEKDELQRKLRDSEKSIQLLESRLASQQTRLASADDEIANLNARLHTSDNALTDLKFKLKDAESQLTEATDQRNKFKLLLRKEETASKDLAAEQGALKQQVAVLEAKLVDSEERYERRIEELRRINIERKTLELSFTDKSSELSALSSLIRQYEQNQSSYMKEVAEEKERCIALEQEISSLRTDLRLNQEELSQCQAQLEKRTVSNQATVADLIENYRTAEKDKMTALRDLDERNAQVEILRHRIELGESKKHELEERVAELERQKAGLEGRLSYYEQSAKRVISYARSQARTQSQGPSGRYAPVTTFDDAPLSPDVSSPLAGPGGRGAGSFPDLSTAPAPVPEFVSSTTPVDVTFQFLKDRISTLEAERSDLVLRLRRTKTEAEDAYKASETHKARTGEVQRQLQELQAERDALEARLSSSKQVLLAQEQSLRAHDNDKKNFKAKIATTDLHIRDKDSRIQGLQNEIFRLKQEVQNLETDRTRLRDLSVSWEQERREVEALVAELKRELANVQRERTAVVRDRETLTQRLRDVEQTSEMSQQRCLELERTIERRQQSLSKLQEDESAWKNKIEGLRRSATDVQQLEVRIETLKIELETMTQKWRHSENDREIARRELVEVRSKLNSAQLKVNDLQTTLKELKDERKRYIDRIEVLEKYERDNAATERELRRDLEQIRNERLTLVAEAEELRRQIGRCEVAKKEYEAQVARLDRERIALKRHAETLEMDKQRVEATVRQTTLERQALDKSLNAMEKENSELYRNCNLLQSQLNQLERETMARSSEANNKRRMQLESEIHRLNQEKRQVEKTLEQREQNYLQRVKMLESQVTALKEQLEAERRRRREPGTPLGGGDRRSTSGNGNRPPFRV